MAGGTLRYIPPLFVTRRGQALPEYAVQLPLSAQARMMEGGTAVRFDGERWWVHAEVPRRRRPPEGFVVENVGPRGRRYGWRPLSGDDEDLRRAIDDSYRRTVSAWAYDDGAAERRARWERPRTEQAVGRPFPGSHHGWAGVSLAGHDHPVLHLPRLPVPADTLLHAARRALRDDPGRKGIVWWADGEPVARVFRTELGLPWREVYWSRPCLLLR